MQDLDELFDEYWEENAATISTKGLEKFPKLISSVVVTNEKIRQEVKAAYKAGFRKANQLSILR